MGRTCSVCAHVDRNAIDVALAGGGPTYRNIAERHGVSIAALSRHAQRHLPLHLSRALMEVLGRVGDALPRPLDQAEMVEGFEWPGGEVRDVVPLESDEEMAANNRIVTPRQHVALPAALPPALSLAGAGPAGRAGGVRELTGVRPARTIAHLGTPAIGCPLWGGPAYGVRGGVRRRVKPVALRRDASARRAKRRARSSCSDSSNHASSSCSARCCRAAWRCCAL